MIEFDELYLADIRDDFEEAGRGERNFNLWDFINEDPSRAFAVGYLYHSFIETKMWIPVSIRKEMRRMNEGMDRYNSQLKWLNKKYGTSNPVVIREYVSFVLDNLFPESGKDVLKIAIILGVNLSHNEQN